MFLYTEPCTADGISNQGPNKRPFTCKEVPSNSVPVEKVEPADNKEDKGVSRLKLPYSVENSAMLQGAPLDKNNRVILLDP